MKSGILKSSLAVAGLFAAATVGAADNTYAKAQKELKIMSRIFETALDDKSSNAAKIYGSKKSDGIYLAKQGMVFSFNFGRNSISYASDWEEFGEGIGHFVGAIASEVGQALSEVPVVPDVPDLPDMGDQRQIEIQFENYQERLHELEEMRENNRDQREQVRELQREIRSLERESERESEDKSRLNKVKDKLQDKLKSLNAKMADYEKSMQDYRDKRDQKYTRSSQLKSDTILATLCDYGATLRSLESNQHFTLIFKGYADGKDQVLVFEADEVQDCDSKDKLLKSAISYQM